MENHFIMFVVLAVIALFKGAILLVKLIYFIIGLTFVLIKRAFNKSKNKNSIVLSNNVNR